MFLFLFFNTNNYSWGGWGALRGLPPQYALCFWTDLSRSPAGLSGAARGGRGKKTKERIAVASGAPPPPQEYQHAPASLRTGRRARRKRRLSARKRRARKRTTPIGRRRHKRGARTCRWPPGSRRGSCPAWRASSAISRIEVRRERHWFFKTARTPGQF